jgi:hypothetical protein
VGGVNNVNLAEECLPVLCSMGKGAYFGREPFQRKWNTLKPSNGLLVNDKLQHYFGGYYQKTVAFC